MQDTKENKVQLDSVGHGYWCPLCASAAFEDKLELYNHMISDVYHSKHELSNWIARSAEDGVKR